MIKAATAGLASDRGVADRISTNMRNLVKGRSIGGDPESQAAAAEHLFRQSITKSNTDPQSVIKSLSAPFSGALGHAFGGQNYGLQQFAQKLGEQLGTDLTKSFGVGGIAGTNPLVPYDLSAPARLIYPVYSPLRNQIPRVAGQGTSHEAKVITNVSGALPGSLGAQARLGISELGGAGNLNNPVQYPTGALPNQGSQTSVDVNIPYKFFGLTEQVSWLAQFAGQGFDDAAGLASLILLQEMMMLEERVLIGGSVTNLAAPGAPGLAARANAGTETPLATGTTNWYVVVTALNYYGESIGGTAASIPVANVAGSLDVTINPVPGALGYNIYIGTGASNPGRTGQWLIGSTGATKFSLSGAVPTSGTNPPATDTTTGSNLDYDGLVSIISGKAAGGTYPAGFKGSYVNQSAGDVFSVNVLNNALLGMWNGYLADPDDVWTDATGAISLSNAISAQAGAPATNYRFNIDQGAQTGARAGLAISELVNPHTRKVVNLKVHPYIPSGTALFLSWTLPHPWANVSNVWENVLVQDYLSIQWPVIDATFKFSLYQYGSLFTPAAQYNGIVQGLQNKVAVSGTSGNGWS